MTVVITTSGREYVVRESKDEIERNWPDRAQGRGFLQLSKNNDASKILFNTDNVEVIR